MSARAEKIVRFAAELFKTEPVTVLPAETGATPQRLNGCADTCASNGCESAKPWPTEAAE